MAERTERQVWMATLAKAPLSQLEEQVKQLGVLPSYSFLRPPEVGLVMVRGRVGGTGQPFNLGEMTMTRCVVQLSGEEAIAGFGYVAGRSHRHAELAAVCDALLQCPQWYDRVQQGAIAALQEAARQQQELQQRQTAATKVNFLTMQRGEG
jgi:alpha-D-ribose 1-methylphosphonate 5-triphosphate synthase subunit PhnG